MADKRVLEQGKWSETVFGVHVAFTSLSDFERAQFYLNQHDDINLREGQTGARPTGNRKRDREYTISFINPDQVPSGFRETDVEAQRAQFNALRDLLVDHYPTQALDAGFEAQVNTYASLAFERATAIPQKNGDLAIYFSTKRAAKDAANILDYQMVGEDKYPVRDVGKGEGMILKDVVGKRPFKVVIPERDVEKFMDAEMINPMDVQEKYSRKTTHITKWSELLDIQEAPIALSVKKLKEPSLFSDQATPDDSPQPQTRR